MSAANRGISGGGGGGLNIFFRGPKCPPSSGGGTEGGAILLHLRGSPDPFLGNARLIIILFVRNFWRVCSQFWLSVRNSV